LLGAYFELHGQLVITEGTDIEEIDYRVIDIMRRSVDVVLW